MPFSAVLSGTLFKVSFLYIFFFSLLSNAADISIEPEKEKAKIDWSKPIVSRGFGLNTSVDDVDPVLVTQYQSGQVFYFFGDHDKAVKKWLPLLDSNFPEAQASMGLMYQAGLGVKKDLKKAFELYKKAAEQNNAIAQNNLGVMFENAFAVDQDQAQATHWYKLSAEQGYRFGQYNYANILLSSNSKNDNLKLIKQYLQKSADQGVNQANEKLKSLE